MPVGMLFDSGQRYSGRAYRDCIVSARKYRVPVTVARRGMRWSSGDGVSLDVLAPEMPFLADTGDDLNENSIVVILHTKSFRELFMGDAGETSEGRLLEEGVDLHADVVKVGHHGSRFASTLVFVAAVRPHIAVISVGRHNTFGHPAPETITARYDNPDQWTRSVKSYAGVAAILNSRQPYGGRAYRDALSAARSKRVSIITARRGMRWLSGDGVALDVLAPRSVTTVRNTRQCRPSSYRRRTQF
jgi:beta-lactamase superfamily II metal-dependent hydrolase